MKVGPTLQDIQSHKRLKHLYPHLIDREVLGEAPGVPYQLCQLVVLPLLGRRLVLLVVHQQTDLQQSQPQKILLSFTSLYTFLSQNFWRRSRRGKMAS